MVHVKNRRLYSNPNGSFAQYEGLSTRLHNKPVFATLKHILKMQILLKLQVC